MQPGHGLRCRMTRLRLAIVRHGKADPNSPTGSDDDRPLLRKGHLQAAHLATELPGVLRPPVVLLSSPIVRAHETAQTIAAGRGWSPALTLRFDDRLATDRGVRDVIEAVEEAHLEHTPASLVVVGHNPHFEALCHELLAGNTGEQGFTGELKTGCAVVVDVAIPLRRHAAKFVTHIRLCREDS
ncbi:MAG: SixA phosphatase family protein [Phycisphaerales bacterium]